jgi:hypothetical protein
MNNPTQAIIPTKEDRARKLLAAELPEEYRDLVSNRGVEGIAVYGSSDEETWCGAALRAITRALAEREAVVAWLRENARLWGPRAGTWLLSEAADAIERGDHMGVGE